jgi:hypothetical protein
MLRPVLAAAALALVAAPLRASAGNALVLGADWLVDPESASLELLLATETRLAQGVTAGVRFGGLYLAEPGRLGAAVDGRIRFRGKRVYADALVGPWIVFDDDDSLRLHAAFGFGILGRSASFGLEVGWLDPTSMVGIRVAFPL